VARESREQARMNGDKKWFGAAKIESWFFFTWIRLIRGHLL
jgi:hypothetical protein